MSRVTTSNYGAVTDTQFAWATTDGDLFDRELDLYRLAQAVENHTHASTRGLAVARLATGAVTTASITALAVDTTALANLSVTNAKLAAGAVTLDKILFPLVQATNDFAGSFRIRESTNVYQMGHYIAANGLAVFGAGTIAGGIVNPALILGQAGQASVGATQGAGKFNVMQSADGAAGGMRIYNTLNGFIDLYQTTGFIFVLNNNSASNSLFVSPTTGYVTVGASVSGVYRLAIAQATEATDQGIGFVFGGGVGHMRLVNTGSLVITSAGTAVQLEHGVANFAPVTTGGATLGRAGLAWGACTVAALTATTLTATTGAFSGAVSTVGLTGTTGTFSGAVSMAGLTATTGSFSSTLVVTGLFTMNGGLSATGNIFPTTDNTAAVGTITNRFAQVICVNGYKPGGGTWTDSSDDRVKDLSKFHPYTSGLDEILKLEPTYYQFNGTYGHQGFKGKDYVGLRAQATQKVAPDLVDTMMAPKNPGDPEEEILTLDMSNFPYKAINAFKELQARIEALEAQLKDRSN